MAKSGTAHKVVSVLLRFVEFASAVIVLAILARFCHLLGVVDANTDGRLIYAMVVASIGIVYTIIFFAPVRMLFLAFPADFVLFIMWLVAYCLLQSRTSHHGCSTGWYNDYWGYYWGRFWRVGPIGRVSINGAGCGQWRTVLAFSFVAWFFHLVSGVLGIYVFSTYIKGDKAKPDTQHHPEKLNRNHSPAYSHERNGQPGATMAQPTVPATNV